MKNFNFSKKKKVSVDNSTCFSLGDIAVSAWDVNAYQDGINLV